MRFLSLQIHFTFSFDLLLQLYRWEDGEATLADDVVQYDSVDEQTKMVTKEVTVKPHSCISKTPCNFILKVYKEVHVNFTSTSRSFRYTVSLRQGIVLERDNHFVAESCPQCAAQLFAASPSFSDFDLGLIVQPDFLYMGEPATFSINKWYELSPSDIFSVLKVSETTMSFTFRTPDNFQPSTYLFFEVHVDASKMRYRIFIQPNSIEYVEKGFGWVLLTAITCIMLCTLYRSCARRPCRRRNIDAATTVELAELNVTIWEEDDSAEACPICMENFQRNEEVRILPCKHKFHKKCIDKWFEEKNSCAICRQRAYSKKHRFCRCCVRRPFIRQSEHFPPRPGESEI